MIDRARPFQKSSCSTRDEAISDLPLLVNEYAGSLSLTLSQLTLIFQLVEDLDVAKDAVRLAEEVLPSLPPLLGAEAVYFVPGRREEDQTTSIAREEPVLHAGKDRIGDEGCRQLVERVREEVEARPVVQNHLSAASAPQDLDSVKHLVVVTVSKEDFFLGWLLAVNRAPVKSLITMSAQAEAANGTQIPWALSDLEFGTEQATLLGSTARILASHGRNVALIREKEALLVGSVHALVSAIEAKDPYTCGHSERVARIAKLMGQEIGLGSQQLERIYLTGLLHDIGKIGVRESVLSKPGKLTDEEFDEIKRHVEIGYTILKDLTPISYVLPGVRHHHESYDGSGYPDGLAGEAIPFEARLLAVADAYDAMTSARPYRDPLPLEKVEQILRQGAGTQWDARLIDAFFRTHPRIQDLLETQRMPAQVKFG